MTLPVLSCEHVSEGAAAALRFNLNQESEIRVSDIPLPSALTSHYLTRCSIRETKMPDVTLEPPVTLQHCDPRTPM